MRTEHSEEEMRTEYFEEELHSVVVDWGMYAIHNGQVDSQTRIDTTVTGLAWYLAENSEVAKYPELEEMLFDLVVYSNMALDAQKRAVGLRAKIDSLTHEEIEQMRSHAAVMQERFIIDLELEGIPRTVIGETIIQSGVKALRRRSSLEAAKALDDSYTKLLARHIKPLDEKEA